jgi:type III secretion system FlhB-like substrate exporter
LSDPSSPNHAADAIVARIRELAHAHGATVREDIGLAQLLSDLRLNDQVPIAAFAVAADMLFHLLAADQRPSAEVTP